MTFCPRVMNYILSEGRTGERTSRRSRVPAWDLRSFSRGSVSLPGRGPVAPARLMGYHKVTSSGSSILLHDEAPKLPSRAARGLRLCGSSERRLLVLREAVVILLLRRILRGQLTLGRREERARLGLCLLRRERALELLRRCALRLLVVARRWSSRVPRGRLLLWLWWLRLLVSGLGLLEILLVLVSGSVGLLLHLLSIRRILLRRLSVGRSLHRGLAVIRCRRCQVVELGVPGQVVHGHGHRFRVAGVVGDRVRVRLGRVSVGVLRVLVLHPGDQLQLPDPLLHVLHETGRLEPCLRVQLARLPVRADGGKVHHGGSDGPVGKRLPAGDTDHAVFVVRGPDVFRNVPHPDDHQLVAPLAGVQVLGVACGRTERTGHLLLFLLFALA